MPPPESVRSLVVTQVLPPSREPRRKHQFKRFAWGLMIAGCGLLVLAAGTLAIRQELDHEISQLVAEYAAKKRDLVAEYQAKQRDLETEYEAKKRELTTELETEDAAKKRELASEYEAQKRGLMAEYATKTHELVVEYQTKKDQNDSATRQAIAEYKRKEEELAARSVNSAQFSYYSGSGDEASTRDFWREALKRKCAAHQSAGLCTGEPLIDEPDDYALDKFEYDLDGFPVDETQVRAYFALPYSARCARCVLSRREMLQAQGSSSMPGSFGH